MKKIGPIQQKMLILLLGGITLSLVGTPTQYFRALKSMRREWRRINQQSFTRSIHTLRQKKLLEEIRRKDGSIALRLTPDGRKHASFFQLFGSAIKINRPKIWDGLWRIVIFDIPEDDKIFRNILRDHLKTIGFKKLQHSVFVFPYPCESAIMSLVELYNAKPYVRIITAKTIDNQRQLQKKFSLSH
ncbi:MAG: hypothetical protein Q8Q10_00215 [bacterium]|nr:hypothetical protein [bacterium]